MEKKFFALNPDVFLVRGAKRGALYDLKTGNVFSVNELGVKILEQLEAGSSLKEIFEQNADITRGKLEGYLLRLQKTEVGSFYERFPVKKLPQLSLKDKTLRYVLHLELTTGCNLRCLHCYNESDISKLKDDNTPSIGNWERVVRDAYEMGCRRVQFIGGEPFLKRTLMFQLVEFAQKLGYKSMEISSNGTLITNSDLDYMRELEIGLALSFYSLNSAVHDLITTRRGSYNKTLSVIKKAIDKRIALRVNVVKMKHNEEDAKETAEFLRHLGVRHIKESVAEPIGRECSNQSIMENAVKNITLNAPKFPIINKQMFWRNRLWHNCFSEQMCIGSDGAVYPCLAERKISYGNVKKQSLSDIFLNKTAKKIRSLNKDKIEICKDCEYRYCCFDCRIKAGDFLQTAYHSKPSLCSYDPYHGQWGREGGE